MPEQPASTRESRRGHLGQIALAVAVGVVSSRIAALRLGTVAGAASSHLEQAPWGKILAVAWLFWLLINAERLRHAGHEPHRELVVASLGWEAAALTVLALASSVRLTLDQAIWLLWANGAVAFGVALVIAGSLKRSAARRGSPASAVRQWAQHVTLLPWRRSPGWVVVTLVFALAIGGSVGAHLTTAVAHDLQQLVEPDTPKVEPEDPSSDGPDEKGTVHARDNIPEPGPAEPTPGGPTYTG